jgi:hypothetical protein
MTTIEYAHDLITRNQRAQAALAAAFGWHAYPGQRVTLAGVAGVVEEVLGNRVVVAIDGPHGTLYRTVSAGEVVGR